MKPEEPLGGASSSVNQENPIEPLFADNKLTNKVDELTLQSSDLEVFREQWKQELGNPNKKGGREQENEQEKENQARALFMQGVECEKRGEMSEAVHKYSSALKLVPDIERKIHPAPATRARSTSRVRTSVPKGPQKPSSDPENDLRKIFKERILEREKLFLPISSESECLLNRLPVEILALIVRYVIGKDINLRLLETVSEVSVGMYLQARNNELWRQIHSRSFGTNQVEEKAIGINWRELYISYPHLQFDGVYISNITYTRHGEASFQDKNFRPWHTVVYLRLVRFFSDGFALMTTSSDTPQTAVNMLKSRVPGIGEAAPGFGTWYQEEDTIVLQINRERPPPPKPKFTKSRQAPVQEYGILKHTFDIIFRIVPMKVAGKWSLQWVENICTVTYLDGKTTSMNMDAGKSSKLYPPLRFYRVKSYTEGCSDQF